MSSKAGRFLTFGLAAMALAGLTGCEDATSPQGPDPSEFSADIFVGDVGVNQTCKTLYAGQTIDAGTVCTSVENGSDFGSSYLLVEYTTKDGWELTEAHLWAGLTLSDMPQTRKGAPKIGNFPDNSGDIAGQTTHTFRVPLSSLAGSEAELCDEVLYVAAHAALRKDLGGGSYQTETGWGDGPSFVSRGTWATYFAIDLKCGDSGPPPEVDSETAFAFGDSYATCFIDADFDGDGSDDGFQRWGWSNGTLAADTESYNFDVYAGAGQCDLTKGTLVGTLEIDYDGSVATVTYTMNSGFYLEETQLYVGSEPLSRDPNGNYTVAPGQYPDIHGDVGGETSDTYEVTGLSGPVYVVAHASVVGNF